MDSILDDPAFVDARGRRFSTAEPAALRGSWAALYVDGPAASKALKIFRDWFASAWYPGVAGSDPELGDEGFRFEGLSEKYFGRRLAMWMWREDNLLLRVWEGDPGPWTAREMAETMDSRIR